jgi:anti-sigma-K factor RskA
MTALAAGLALALYLAVAQPDPPAAPPAATAAAPAPALVAALAAEDGTAALAIAFEPERGSVLVTPTLLQPAAGHDHELWLIAGEGAAPVSLGLVRTTAPQRLAVPAALRGALRPAATLALSVEPTGGSPTGAPTGPVIAAGR